jgi:pyridoxamine 5'-phosphate oxidase
MSSTNQHINTARLSYTMGQLLETEISTNPYTQFEQWMQEALNANVKEPYAMQLATVDADNYPSIRVVLLREICANQGMVFYTNYSSSKGKAIASNAKVSASFFWQDLERQVRIKGTIQKVSTQKSDIYFNSRPHESKIGAIVSAQSQVIASRKLLDDNYAQALTKYSTETPVRPAHWGGYIIEINKFEFWQGRASRMHDRITYIQATNNVWTVQRLQP